MPEESLDLSVVVASFTGEEALGRCLQSLVPQVSKECGEVIVASNLAEDVLGSLRSAFPDVKWLAASVDADVFVLRSLGAKQAQGRQVAFLEDHVTVAPGWWRAMREAHGKGRLAVGGPVDNGHTERAYDWALYFVEYGLYMPPWTEGEASILSGINAAYDRSLLESCRSVWEAGFRENEVHDALRESGESLYRVPEAWVKSHLEMPFSVAADHLYTGGRHFGGYRRSQTPGWRKLFWAVAWPAIPFVLAARLTRRIAGQRPAWLGRLLVAKPWYLALLMAWSAGEAIGGLLPGGDGR